MSQRIGIGVGGWGSAGRGREFGKGPRDPQSLRTLQRRTPPDMRSLLLRYSRQYRRLNEVSVLGWSCYLCNVVCMSFRQCLARYESRKSGSTNPSFILPPASYFCLCRRQLFLRWSSHRDPSIFVNTANSPSDLGGYAQVVRKRDVLPSAAAHSRPAIRPCGYTLHCLRRRPFSHACQLIQCLRLLQEPSRLDLQASNTRCSAGWSFEIPWPDDIARELQSIAYLAACALHGALLASLSSADKDTRRN